MKTKKANSIEKIAEIKNVKTLDDKERSEISGAFALSMKSAASVCVAQGGVWNASANRCQMAQ